MISLRDTTGNVHQIRHVDDRWGDVLRLWQRTAPDHKIFCQLHGYEEIGSYDPFSIMVIRDRIAEQQAICGDLEAQDREKFAKDLERAQRRK